MSIVVVKLVTLIGVAALAKTISGFLESLDSPAVTMQTAGSAILSALLIAAVTFCSELLRGELEYRCTTKVRTALRTKIFSKVLELDAGNIEKSGLSLQLPPL